MNERLARCFRTEPAAHRGIQETDASQAVFQNCIFCLARYRPQGHSIARVLEEILVVLLEVVCETHHLKAVAITDGPELQLGTVAVLTLAVAAAIAILVALDPPDPVGNLIHGSIHARCPAA